MKLPPEDAVWLQDIHEWTAGNAELESQVALLEKTLEDTEIVEQESKALWSQLEANLQAVDNLRAQKTLTPADEKVLADAIIETLERAKEQAQQSTT